MKLFLGELDRQAGIVPYTGWEFIYQATLPVETRDRLTYHLRLLFVPRSTKSGGRQGGAGNKARWHSSFDKTVVDQREPSGHV